MNQRFMEFTYHHNDVIPLELYAKSFHEFSQGFSNFCKKKYGRDDFILGLYEVAKGSKIIRIIALSARLLEHSSQLIQDVNAGMKETAVLIEAIDHFANTIGHIYDMVPHGKDPTSLPQVDNKIARQVCSSCIVINGNVGDNVTFVYNADGKATITKSLEPPAIKKIQNYHNKVEKEEFQSLLVTDLPIHISQADDTGKFKATSAQFTKTEVELTDLERLKLINLKVGQLFEKDMIVDGLVQYKSGKAVKFYITQIKTPIEETEKPEVILSN
jgi:hypothetical protein